MQICKINFLIKCNDIHTFFFMERCGVLDNELAIIVITQRYLCLNKCMQIRQLFISLLFYNQLYMTKLFPHDLITVNSLLSLGQEHKRKINAVT